MSPTTRALAVVLVVIFFACVSHRACGQPPDADPSQVRLWRDYYAKLAAQHEFASGDKGPAAVRLRAEPVQVYSNPAGGSQTHGAIFVWTKDSRPVVIGAFWSRKIGDTRRVARSLHRASQQKLRGIHNGETFWQPQQPFNMQPWPAAGSPAPAATQRLVQMKNIVRSLEAVRVHEDQRSRLRALARPVYRYQNAEVTDGAVFALFEDWDPELFIVVEAGAEQPGGWRLAVARFSDKQLTVSHEGQTIWAYDPQGDEPRRGGADYAYISQTIETRPHLIDTEEAP